MKRIFTLFLILTLFCTALSVRAFAEEEGEGENISSAAHTASEGGIVKENAEPSDDGSTEMSLEKLDTDTESSEKGRSDESRNTAEIYELILTHVSGIISVLTLALSVILTNLYKKKLVPTLGGALGNIGDSVKNFGERAEVTLATTEEVARRIGIKIDDIDGVIENFNLTLSEMEKRMCELEAHKKNGESIKIMMRSEVEELSRIFSSGDLSEINRKTVEEKLTVIKSHLE